MADSDEGVLDGIPLIREAFSRTVRLVASARLRDAVMTPLADDTDDLALLAEIEGATSRRLIAEERGYGGLTAVELVHGVPHAKFINASFAYAKPREPMRFSPAERGAWYAALAVETCIAEVGHHLTKALADAGDFNAAVEYGEMLASMAGVFLDLRHAPGHLVSIPIQPSDILLAMHLPPPRVQQATTASYTRRCVTPKVRASPRSGLTSSNRSCRGRCIA